MAFIKPKTPTPEAPPAPAPASPAELESQLNAADAGIRRQAARSLGDMPGSGVPLLLTRLRQETDGAVREAIMLALTEIGDTAAVQGFVQCLHSESVALRNEAIEAMKQLPGTVAPVMAGLLNDPDADVRIFAVNVLESLRHPEVESWLINVISHDPHVNVCGTAVDLLGEVGSTAAIEPLEALKRRFSGEPYIEFAADLALRRIRGD
jgi:HEAT repeat protein